MNYVPIVVATDLEVHFSVLKKGCQYFCLYNVCTSHWCLVMSFWRKVCIYKHTVCDKTCRSEERSEVRYCDRMLISQFIKPEGFRNSRNSAMKMKTMQNHRAVEVHGEKVSNALQMSTGVNISTKTV